MSNINLDTLKAMSKEDMAALILKMQSAPQGRLTVKVRTEAQTDKKTGKPIEPKGTIMVYGLQKFPVSLYPSQWKRLFAVKAEIEACFPVAEAIVEARKAA